MPSFSPEIKFILHLLEFISEPENALVKLQALTFLANHKLKIDNKHDFLVKFVDDNLEAYFKRLENYNFFFTLSTKPSTSEYDLYYCS